MKLSTISKSVLVGLLFSSVSYSSEISLLSGFYKSNKDESSFDTTELSLGGRYLQNWEGNLDFYGQIRFESHSFSAEGNNAKPKDNTGIDVEFGIRKSLNAFSPRLIPYLSGGIGVLNDKAVAINNTSITKRSGIVYNGKIGVKIKLGEKYFVDLETPLFESNLQVTDKTGNSEVKKTEIFASSFNSNIFDKAVISLGYYL